MNQEEGEACHSIVYVSTAIANLSEAGLLHLLRRARCANQLASITGVLMYGGGQFLHVMEGCPAAVRRLYARIEADPRHSRLIKLADGLLPQREFKGWHMSFAPLPASYLQGVPGYLTPPQLAISGAGTSVQQVLCEFLEYSNQSLLI
ncbi:MAG: BLUF domain-containing protein [Janthinobacterium lividum]